MFSGLDVPFDISEYTSTSTSRVYGTPSGSGAGVEYKGLYVPPATESDYGYLKGPGTLPPLSGPIRGYAGGSSTNPPSLRDHESPQVGLLLHGFPLHLTPRWLLKPV